MANQTLTNTLQTLLEKELKILILDLMVFRCKQFYGIAVFLQFNKSIVLFCYN